MPRLARCKRHAKLPRHPFHHLFRNPMAAFFQDHPHFGPGHFPGQVIQVVDRLLPLARVANPACQVVGVSINTQALGDDEAQSYCVEIEARLGLPTTDPFRYGAGKLVDALSAV